MNENRAGLGFQDFEEVRTKHIFYIDKTNFIGEWWDYADRSDLFEGLSIWEQKSCDGEYRYRKLQGTFPVIFLSFANVKATSYKEMIFQITKVIADLYEKNSYLLTEELFSENERTYYKSIKMSLKYWIPMRTRKHLRIPSQTPEPKLRKNNMRQN